MIKRTLIPVLMFASSFAAAAELTHMETRWLSAGLSVINYARQELKLPLDITVQPQARASDVPVALGYQDGRCKLVLSLRGNDGAEDILQAVPASQKPLMIEAMFAHEIAHCWRYAQGAWHAAPSAFQQGGERSAAQSLRDTRREEGFADLLALAWTQQQHPEHYAAVAAWMQQVRQPGTSGTAGSHSTTAWLQLAQTGAAFNSRLPLFEQAGSLWRQGLARGQ
ncbi:MAG: hypothetical protein ABW202_16190 [Duganella sp.]